MPAVSSIRSIALIPSIEKIGSDTGDKIGGNHNDEKQDQSCYCDDLDWLEPDHDAKAEDEDSQIDLQQLVDSDHDFSFMMVRPNERRRFLGGGF